MKSGKNGTIEHREYVRQEEGSQAVIQTRNDWMSPEGKRVCEDLRAMTFGADHQMRWIDFQVRVTASDGRVVFGDTKEGSFGVRVAGTMSVDRKLGGKIVNSEGQVDADAWGKRAAWVDYTGPVDGEIVGIAISITRGVCDIRYIGTCERTGCSPQTRSGCATLRL